MTAFLTGLGTGVCLALALVAFVGARQLRLEARAKREATEREAAEEAARKARTEHALNNMWGGDATLRVREFGKPKWIDLGEVKVFEVRDLYGRVQTRSTAPNDDERAARELIDSITDEWSRE